MAPALIGRKVGMSRYYLEDGTNIPVTVIAAGPCVITQVKTLQTDGYSAVQMGFEDIRPGRSTMPQIGHDAKAGATPKRVHREIEVSEDEIDSFELGASLTVEQFEDVTFVDVVGTSKGKGFAGSMKRHHFKGLEASHGVKRAHRRGGSIAGHATNLGTGPKVKKGKRMPGHMGAERVTVRSLDVVKIDPAEHIMLVKGSVPGPNSGLVLIRESRRLNRRKQHAAG